MSSARGGDVSRFRGRRDDKKRRKIMKAEIINGNLVLTLPLSTPTPSATGKTLVVASSHGNKETTAKVEGKPIVVGVNAYIYR
jgi:hypothetical protein